MSEQAINKGLLIAGSLLGLGILSYFLFRERGEITEDAEFTIVEDSKPDKVEQSAPKVNPVPTAKIKPKMVKTEQNETAVEVLKVQTEPNDDFPLKLGSKGERVQQLQVYLLRNHGSAGIVTNEFDTITAERVVRFLKVKTVSQSLFEKLNMAGKKTKTSNGSKKKH